MSSFLLIDFWGFPAFGWVALGRETHCMVRPFEIPEAEWSTWLGAGQIEVLKALKYIIRCASDRGYVLIGNGRGCRHCSDGYSRSRLFVDCRKNHDSRQIGQIFDCLPNRRISTHPITLSCDKIRIVSFYCRSVACYPFSQLLCHQAYDLNTPRSTTSVGLNGLRGDVSFWPGVYEMHCCTHRTGAYWLIVKLLVFLLPGLSVTQTVPDDPIVYTGHGQYFTADGTEIDQTLEFVDNALDAYQAHLLAAASESQRAMFESMATRVLDDARDAQANLVVRAKMVDWLARSVFTPENPSLLRRLRALDYSLQRHLGAGVNGLFTVQPAVQTLIDTQIPNSVVLAFSTEAGGDMYVKECRAAGVPIPQAWGKFGSGEWVDHGILTDAQEFIDQTKEAQVYTYESDAPDGVCIALPRANDDDGNGVLMDPNDRISPLGIICLGRTTGNACFWDANNGDGSRFSIDKGEVVELSRFAGGADLRPGPDVCTRCHAGENPFTIHPGTSLQPSGVSFKSSRWYNPLVVPEWPQNAGPANNVDSIVGIDNCTGCHSEGNSGGRFPQLSTRISGYCNTVLTQAINRTMPTTSPGSQADQVHTDALRALCNDAPVPILRIEENLLDFGEVEIGFAFTKALLIHNVSDAPLIIDSLTLTTPPGEFTEISEITEPTTLNPGDPPLTLRQTFEPTIDGVHTAQLNLQSSVIAGSLTISLEGVGKNPEPIDSVLVLDRSGSMAEYAGDRTKISAMRDASSAYMDLLREAQGSFGGDRLGLVKYNNGNADYLAMDNVTQPFKDSIAANELSNTALNDTGRLRPGGGTGIGGALERGATMIGAADPSRAQVLVVMTDGVETQSPFIEDVLGPIGSSNAQLQLYSVGVGEDIEPDKLQSITNQGELGYHQVSAGLDAFAMFDLESFYFKIFANAAGMDLAAWWATCRFRSRSDIPTLFTRSYFRIVPGPMNTSANGCSGSSRTASGARSACVTIWLNRPLAIPVLCNH